MALTPEQTEQVIRVALELARTGSTAELLEFVDHGLPVDAWDEQHNTLLMLAAYHGHGETVRALLDRGADPDLLNSRNQSVIAGALFKGEDAIVRLLIEVGADLDLGTPTAREAADLFNRTHLLHPSNTEDSGNAEADVP